MIVKDPTRARNGGTIGPEDFADIATCTRVTWAADGALDIQFDRDLTPDEEAAVRRRCASCSDTEVTLRERANGALDSNRAFLALPSPTATQNAAQVKALTRQIQGVLRLVLSEFDGTD